VILAGGAFNTPQLLMLSGIGPEEVLTAQGVGIECRCKLPGVGQNLQDRYEVAVVTKLPDDSKGFSVLDGSKFYAPGDPPPNDRTADQEDVALKEWMNHRGVYATNGAVMTIIRRSKLAKERNAVPDLFVFGLPGNFRGYERGYSRKIQGDVVNNEYVPNHRRFTWAILKGRTRFQKGYVKLTSNDPFVRPEINFRYFRDSADAAGGGNTPADWQLDLAALVETVLFVRELVRHSAPPGTEIIWPPKEKMPPEEGDVTPQTIKTLGQFIQAEAWGHHACGTCKIGTKDDPQAVLDGDFRVRGVQGLRVVDASVFPNIPGFFIVSSIYMISEKASDVILQYRIVADAYDSDKSKPPPKTWPTAPDGP
jgi:choline dehydrogenase